MSPILSCKDLTFSYSEGTPLLANVSFDLDQGSIGVLIGRSGSGKTTLFKLLTGALKPDEGSIEIKGTCIQKAKDQISYMTHTDLLLPWRSALDNVLLAADLSSLQSKDIYDRALYLLETVGLYSYKDELPEKLSQGMRQRVALARTLLLKRPLILLDEPFGSLDLITKSEMYDLVNQFVQSERIALLIITHDVRDCQSLMDKLFVIKGKTLKSHLSSDFDESLDVKLCQSLIV